MSWGSEVGPIPGHEHLTLADQMVARRHSQGPHTSPINGSIQNPRREYLKNKIAQRMGGKGSSPGAKSGHEAGSLSQDSYQLSQTY